LAEDSSNSGESQQSLLNKLIKRHVIHSAAIYIAVAWGAVEILITVQEKLGWHPMISTWATRLFVAGFPFVIILAWRRDIESRLVRFAMGAGAFVVAGIALWLTLSTDPADREARPALEPVTTAIATVVVLPFENANGDASLDYLANGFTGELIGRISKHPDLAVIQEESVSSPSLLGLIPAAQATALRADYMVQGKVLREGGFVEVAASLQDLDGRVLWSDILREPYTASGVTTMQRRISGEVSRVLGATLDAPAYCGETSDLEAMELYYRGRQLIGKRNLEDALAGVELVKQAVEMDPYFGRAWNEAGNGNWYAAGQYFSQRNPEQASLKQQLAMSAYRKALDICPTIGMAYKVIVPPYEDAENDIIDQEMQWRDALAMDPNDAAMLRQYFYHLMEAGMLNEAIEVMQRAYETEPLTAMIPAQYAHGLMKAGRCEEAIPLAEEAERLGGHPSASIKVNCFMEAGDIDGVLETTAAMVAYGLEDPFQHLGRPGPEVVAATLDPEHELRPYLATRLRELWEENTDFMANDNVYWIIDMAVTIGEYDLVFDMLETIARPEGDFHGYTVAWSPLFANKTGANGLRSHPRFVETLNLTGLPTYWRKYGWPNGCEADGESFRCF
jgi:TolB-like protein